MILIVGVLTVLVLRFSLNTTLPFGHPGSEFPPYFMAMRKNIFITYSLPLAVMTAAATLFLYRFATKQTHTVPVWGGQITAFGYASLIWPIGFAIPYVHNFVAIFSLPLLCRCSSPLLGLLFMG